MSLLFRRVSSERSIKNRKTEIPFGVLERLHRQRSNPMRPSVLWTRISFEANLPSADRLQSLSMRVVNFQFPELPTVVQMRNAETEAHEIMPRPAGHHVMLATDATQLQLQRTCLMNTNHHPISSFPSSLSRPSHARRASPMFLRF
jgi:hypothetical protein